MSKLGKYKVSFCCPNNKTMFAVLVEAADFQEAVNHATILRNVRLVNPERYRVDGIEIVSPDSNHVRYTLSKEEAL